MSRRDPLCPRCDRAFFQALVKAHPTDTIDQLAKRAKSHLGYVPHAVTLGGFLRDQRIERLSQSEKAALRFEQARSKARQAAARRRPAQPLVLDEHRALARNASIFALASEVDQ